MTSEELKEELHKKFDQNEICAPLCALADHNKNITDNRLAYRFDKIKDILCRKEKLRSADAMVVTDRRVYLIEFKTGFEQTRSFDTEVKKIRELQREAMRTSVRLKACESLILLEKVLCKGEEAGFQKCYIAVINASEDPLGARSDAIDEAGGTEKSISEKKRLMKELTENSLLVYRKETDKKHIMYHDIQVIYDSEFDCKMAKIR